MKKGTTGKRVASPSTGFVHPLSFSSSDDGNNIVDDDGNGSEMITRSLTHERHFHIHDHPFHGGPTPLTQPSPAQPSPTRPNS